MPGTYSHTTLQQLIDQVAADLNDASKVFFTDAEIKLNVEEALRVWNVLTAWHRVYGSFTTTAGTGLYDLGTEFSSNLAPSVTDRDIVTKMQYHLMEPPDGIDSTGISEMFTHADLVRALQQRRNRFLADTSCVTTAKAAINVPFGQSIIDLDDTTISIVRAVWIDGSGRYHTLRPSDEYVAGAAFNPWRQTSKIPRLFSIAAQPNLTLQLIPEPADNGQLLLWTVETGDNLDTTAGANGTVLGIPDDMCWVVMWGALGDLLLRDGIGRDPIRAEFCLKLYEMGVELSNSLPTVMAVGTVQNVSHSLSDITLLDAIDAGWQGKDRGVPKKPALMAGDWLALSPVPDAQYQIGVHYVRQTPMIAVGANLQLGREQLRAIAAWAKHLCQFKQQGAQLQQGMVDARKMIECAQTYNEERISKSQYLCELLGVSNFEQWRPVRSEATKSRIIDSDEGDTASTVLPRGTRKRLGGR